MAKPVTVGRMVFYFDGKQETFFSSSIEYMLIALLS